MKMEKKTFERVYKQYFGLALKKCGEKGFRGEDRIQAAQEVFLELLKVELPPSLTNERAWIARFFENTAAALQRAEIAQKRKPQKDETESDTGELFIPIEEAHLTADVDLDDSLDQQRIKDAVRELVYMLPPEHRALMLARLDDDPDSLFEQFGKGKSQEALRALRRLIGLPCNSPARACVRDPVEYLTHATREPVAGRRVAPALAASSANPPNLVSSNPAEKETSCACGSSPTTNAFAASGSEHQTPATLDAIARSRGVRPKTLSGASVVPKRTSSSVGGRTLPARSPPPLSDSDRSRRLVRSKRPSGGSTPTPVTTSTSGGPRGGSSTPIPADLASAPTFIRNKAPTEPTSTEREPLIDEEPSFSGGNR